MRAKTTRSRLRSSSSLSIQRWPTYCVQFNTSFIIIVYPDSLMDFLASICNKIKNFIVEKTKKQMCFNCQILYKNIKTWFKKHNNGSRKKQETTWRDKEKERYGCMNTSQKLYEYETLPYKFIPSSCDIYIVTSVMAVDINILCE